MLDLFKYAKNSNKKKDVYANLILLWVSLTTNAFTAEELESLKWYFKNIDTSGDGYVSEDEFDFFVKEVGPSEVIAPAIFLYFDNTEKGITF